MSRFYVISGVWSTMLRDPFIKLNVEMYEKCAALGCRSSTHFARQQLEQAVRESRFAAECKGFLQYVDMLLTLDLERECA